jgi:hypothetical protein
MLANIIASPHTRPISVVEFEWSAAIQAFLHTLSCQLDNCHTALTEKGPNYNISESMNTKTAARFKPTIQQWTDMLTVNLPLSFYLFDLQQFELLKFYKHVPVNHHLSRDFQSKWL